MPVAGFSVLLMAYIAAMLTGAGIATQPSFIAAKGLHGSTLFTLSLPVSRLRLLAVRAGLGWLEMAGFAAALSMASWLTLPSLRQTVPPQAVLGYTVVLAACMSWFYSISVLFSTFLDEIWRIWASFLSFAALWWIAGLTSWPDSVNVFRAMSDRSPLTGHAMPWTAMGLSVAASAILFMAAVKIARTREY